VSDLTVKRNDVGVIFTDTLTANGAPIPGGILDAEVLFILSPRHATTPKLTATADIVDPDACTVKYVTQLGDLDTSGHYRQEWQATLTTGEVYTFPSDGYNKVTIVDDLNPPGS